MEGLRNKYLGIKSHPQPLKNSMIMPYSSSSLSFSWFYFSGNWSPLLCINFLKYFLKYIWFWERVMACWGHCIIQEHHGRWRCFQIYSYCMGRHGLQRCFLKSSSKWEEQVNTHMPILHAKSLCARVFHKFCTPSH